MGGGGTLVPNGVKVVDKGKMWKIMKFDKIGLKLSVDIGIEELCPNIVQSLLKSSKMTNMCCSFFPFSLKLRIS